MARCSEDATPLGAQRLRLDTPGGRSWSGADDDDSEIDVFGAERYFNGDDALWCAARSSTSTLSSSVFRTGTTHERDRSVVTTTTTAAGATSSSEASSWNSRSALLPEGRRALADVAPGFVEAEVGGSEPPREKPSLLLQPPPSHLRRWLLGVAGCACIGGGDDGRGSSSTDDDLCSDEVEDGVGGKKHVIDGAGELFQSRTQRKEHSVAEAATSGRARPGSSWLDDGQEVLAGEAAAFSHVQVTRDDSHHRQAVKPGEFPAPSPDPATTAAALSHEQRRRISSETLRPPSLGDTWSAFPSAQQDSAAFTIIAGKTSGNGALRAAAGAGAGGGRAAATPRWPGTTSRCEWIDDDDIDSSSPVELVAGCPYPPSEASVDWSVVTAEGVASCNFSSAASGYYYYHLNGASRPAAPRRDNNRRRRCGATNGGGLLTCMGNRAVDAVGPARRPGDHDVMRRR